MPLYAEAFESVQRLDRLNAFLSHFGADFYGIPRNSGEYLLIKRQQRVPLSFSFGDVETVVPIRAGETIAWSGPD